MGFSLTIFNKRRAADGSSSSSSPKKPQTSLSQRLTRRPKKNSKSKISKAASALLFLAPSLTQFCHEQEEATEAPSSIESVASEQLTCPCPEYPQQRPSRKSPSSSLPNNLTLVNIERCSAGLPPLHRSYELDALAAIHVERMVHHQDLIESCEVRLRQKLGRCWGENVAIGASIQAIHQTMIRDDASEETRNIRDPHFRQMGIATLKAANGQIYLCQLFRG